MGKVITLRRRKDFERLFSEGRRFYHALLTTVVLVRDDWLPPRAAFIASHQIGKAVVRNKVRRRLRELWRRIVDNVDRSADVAFVTHPAAASATYAQLATVVGNHLREAGLTNHNSVEQL